MTPIISPSILAANFVRLEEEIRAVDRAGCDYIHVDVMDGLFVPNITIGQPVVKALTKVTDKPLDVHLMIDDPERYLDSFAEAGADIICVHAEACRHLHRALQRIRALGKKSAVSLNPATPPEAIEWVLDELDMVLVMSVNPGFGGQSFIPSSLDKVRTIRDTLDRRGLTNVDIEVDGGVVVDNIATVAQAGANVFVSGTGIFRTPDYAATIKMMKENASNVLK